MIGDPVIKPGLHAKRPWQRAYIVDGRLRLLTFASREMKSRLHEPFMVQPYACWLIPPDGLNRFTRSLGDDRAAKQQLRDLIWQAFDESASVHTLADWMHTTGEDEAVTNSEGSLLSMIIQTCKKEANRRFGIDIVDIGLQRLSLPDRMADGAFHMMAAEGKRVVNEVTLATKIQSADIKLATHRQINRILAENIAGADEIRTTGRLEADQIYTETYRLNADLARLADQIQMLRTLLADESTLESVQTLLSGEQDSTCRTLNQPNTTSAPASDVEIEVNRIGKSASQPASQSGR